MRTLFIPLYISFYIQYQIIHRESCQKDFSRNHPVKKSLFLVLSNVILTKRYLLDNQKFGPKNFSINDSEYILEDT